MIITLNIFQCNLLELSFSRVLQPYTLGLLIWHFDPRATSTVTEAYLYATAVVVLITLTAFIHHHTQLGSMEIGMRMRVACSSLVYRKVIFNCICF